MNFLKLKKMNIGSIRKMYYTPESIVHPAKMDIPLLHWILNEYVRDGDVVLDPMCGIGTTLVEGMRMYPDSVFIGVELEEKFVELARGNIGKAVMHSATDLFKPKTATAFVVKRDARELSKLLIEYVDKADGRTKITSLVGADAIVTSPSYGGAEIVDNSKSVGKWGIRDRKRLAADTFKSKENLGMIKEYGKVDKIVTSPPFAGSKQVLDKEFYAKALKDLEGRDVASEPAGLRQEGDSPGNLGNPPYGSIDKIVTSPPFAGNKGGLKSAEGFCYGEDEVGKRMMGGIKGGTGDNPENLDNAPYDTGDKTYLSEMLKVYAECNAVLKMGGLMILVTKNFVKNGEQVRLDEDTIRLCEVCGFELVKRHYRKLRGESFWRILYRRKWEKEHPGEPCPVPQWEDILVFRKIIKDALPF